MSTLTKQLLESVGARTLDTFAIGSPCAVVRDLAAPLEQLWIYHEQTNVSWDCSAGTACTF